ncbi:MAG: hypothetical protein IPJ38_18970 [Dechloromonas sp.]|uniref:Uncharacterized protein n=1 Tax=Candidatus Dechloromonas phosphorivorans TaxID=2899244 RepID=A0A935K585_9RHOO|nr:hypothetical protein [Candidatus Dechloromonas phosphorivorans]
MKILEATKRITGSPILISIFWASRHCDKVIVWVERETAKVCCVFLISHDQEKTPPTEVLCQKRFRNGEERQKSAGQAEISLCDCELGLLPLQPSEDRVAIGDWGKKLPRLQEVVSTMGRLAAWGSNSFGRTRWVGLCRRADVLFGRIRLGGFCDGISGRDGEND